MAMKTLTDYEWEMSYRSSSVNDEGKPVDILHDFYLPALERIVKYDRVAGYFRSSSLAAASQGFTQFLEHGGKMRLIVGADLAVADVSAILNGNMALMSESLLRELENEDAWTEEVKNGVALLSEMVARGMLEVRVAFRINSKTGSPLSIDSVEDGYVHEKWFIMEDSDGNKMSGGGSLNESKTALTLNAENINVYCDWDGIKFRKEVNKAVDDFEAFWNNKNPHMRVLTLPEAVKKRLVRLKNLRNKPTEIDWTQFNYKPVMSPEELLRFAVLKDAPMMPNGIYIGMYSAPVELWPHQEIVVRRLVETYPYSYMICDEVGLGKTIEAALAMRSLLLSGRVKRILVIAPASLTSQWHNELADKALLSFARSFTRVGCGSNIVSSFIIPDKEELHQNLFSEDKNIVSSGLAQRKERQKQFVTESEFDIVLLDEAHYARRKNPSKHDEGEADYGNLYKFISDKVVGRTKALWLATATPMQIDSVEAYDLLRLAKRSGPFMQDASICLEYFEILGKLASGAKINSIEWQFLGQSYVQLEALDNFLWNMLQRTTIDSRNSRVLRDMIIKEPKSVDIKFLKKPLFIASPLARVMQRHTRSLLEIYKRNGKLKSNLAQRIIRPIAAIEFTPKEKAFYLLLDEYCSELRKQIQANTKTRQVMFFYLSFLQLRFASSLDAVKNTLARRLEKVNNTLLVGAISANSETELKLAMMELGDNTDIEDNYDEAEFGDITMDTLLKDRSEKDLKWEKYKLESMLKQLDDMSDDTPSKINRLLEEIQQRRIGNRVKQMVIFTRFYDTLESIRKYLLNRGRELRVGVYSGGVQSYYDYEKDACINTTRDKIKQLFCEGEIDILLCTDAAAEGLNLQTADLLINFDLGWNPMKIEQRIGRIDRIGQKHDTVEILNMCYIGSAEEAVYGRLLDRLSEANTVVGSQQISILSIRSDEFRQLQYGEIDERKLEKIARERMKKEKKQVAAMEMSAEDIYDIYSELSREAANVPVPADIYDLWEAFSTSDYLKETFIKVADDIIIEKEELAEYQDLDEEDGETQEQEQVSYTCNRDALTDGVRLLTWGSELTDKVFLNIDEQLADKKWLRKLTVNDEAVIVTAYVVATTDGSKLITSYKQLKGIHIDTKGVIEDAEYDAYKLKLQSELQKESKIYSRIKDTLKRNAEFADINAQLIKYSAAGVLEKVAKENDCDFYQEAYKFIEENMKQSYIVKLPFDIFHGKAKQVLFNVTDRISETTIVVKGTLLKLAVKCMQREVDSIHQKKSTIEVKDVVRRLRNQYALK